MGRLSNVQGVRGLSAAGRVFGQFSSAEFGSLNAAVAAIGAGTDLVVPAASALTANLVIPATLHLDARGGVIATGAFTLTISGPFTCDARKCFDLTGGGSVIFTNSPAGGVLPHWFGARETANTDDAPAILAAANSIAHQGVLRFPRSGNAYRLGSTVTFTGPIRLVGDGRWVTTITAIGFASGQPLFRWYSGVPFTYIRGASMSGFYCFTNNANGAVMQLDYVARSSFSDLWVEGMQDVCRMLYCWGNTYREIETNSLSRWGFLLDGECNRTLIDACVIDGTTAASRGVYVQSGLSGLNITNCIFEGFDALTSVAIMIAPAATFKVNNVNIVNNYFEGMAGLAINTALQAVGDVRNLIIKGNRFWGGFVGRYASVAGYATNAMFLAKCYGVEITGNNFDDFATNCIYSNGDSDTGRVQFNTYKAGLTLITAVDTAFTTSSNKAFA